MRKTIPPPSPAPINTEKKKFRITHDLLAMVRNMTRSKSIDSDLNKYAAYEPMRGILPAKTTGKSIAMDAGFDYSSAVQYGAIANIDTAFQQGYAFPGFQVLAEWAQIPEFRRPAETYAREMTRKWITFKAVGDDNKSEKIAKIEKEFKRLNVQAKFREAIEQDGLFGRSHIFVDMGSTIDAEGKDELKTALVESPDKIGIGSIKCLTVVEPMWVYPNRYNANNPIDPTFYKPITWYCLSSEIHSSRLLTIITREVPDILKPSYAFAGVSLSQLMKPYVDNWLRTRQSVSDLIHSFTVFVLSMDMSTMLESGGSGDFYNRLELFNMARDNAGIMAIDKDAEAFQNVAANIGGLDKLQAQAQEQQCSPSGLPLVYLTGITPSGLNATSEGEIEVFQDTLSATQEILTPHLSKILNLVMLSLFGEIDPDIGFVWNKLKVVTESEKANIRKVEAETDMMHIDMGVIAPDEVRSNLANEEESRYSGLDLTKEIIPSEDPSIDPELMGHGHAAEK